MVLTIIAIVLDFFGLILLSFANIPGIEDRLPNMANGERVVLVESFVDYRPAFNVGINDITFDNFTLTRPRYAGQVPYSDDVTPPPAT